MSEYQEFRNKIHEFSNKIEINPMHKGLLLFPNKFGLVKRGGKTFIRNYGKPLKNGKGLNIFEAEYALVENGLTFSIFYGGGTA